jgi:hypothetical protein
LGILLISTAIAILAASLSLALGTGLLLAFLIYTAAGSLSCMMLASGIVLRCWILRQQATVLSAESTLARDIRS